VLRLLTGHDIEPDQKLQRAFELASPVAGGWGLDFAVFVALCHLNALAVHSVLRSPDSQDVLRHQIKKLIDRVPQSQPFVFYDEIDERIIKRAVKSLGGRKTLGVADYLSAVVGEGEDILRWARRDPFDFPFNPSDAVTPYTVDFLTRLLGRNVESVLVLLNKLRSQVAAKHVEDFQFVLGLERGRIVFRVTSPLGDFVQETDSHLWVAHRVLLRHFKDQFGGFTTDEICELEELINTPKAGESDFHRFFEKYPHFFRRWDHREVYSHVVLTRTEGDLVPDFILVDQQLQRATIAELKLPSPKLVRRQPNRVRFADAVMEARAQLLEYREWFRESANRERLRASVGMSIYEPQLTVIIGRASEFSDEIDRQKLRARSPEIEVVTYDDILVYARRRQIVISGSP
jgi:hypothetical protein